MLTPVVSRTEFIFLHCTVSVKHWISSVFIASGSKCDTVWYGMVWCGLVLYGMNLYGIVWYGLEWYCMVWLSLVVDLKCGRRDPRSDSPRTGMVGGGHSGAQQVRKR